MYFSRKQYFRDTTAPAGLSETIPFRNVPPVKGRFVNIPNPETLDRRSDYYGNELLTIKDRNGVIRQISLMRGANKPRGIDANIKWSMTPNKFKRGRGLRTDTNLFYQPPKRREMTTEFFKSRYQSAYDEMLIAKKIRDSEKVGANQIKTLNEQNKKLQDRLDATLQSNKIAEDRLAQDKLHHQQLLLAISNTSTPSVIQMGTPAGNAAAALVGAGGGQPPQQPPPQQPPQLPPTDPVKAEAESKKAREAAQAGLGAGSNIVEQLKAVEGLSPLDILKAVKQQKATPTPPPAQPAAELPPLQPPPPPPKGKGKGKKGKDAPPPPPADPDTETTDEEGEPEAEPQQSKLQLLEDKIGADPDAPPPVFAGGGLAPAISAGAESAVSVSDTPRTRERKLKFFGRRGLQGGLEEVDIAKLDEEGVKAVGASTAFNDEEKIEILSGLKGKMSKKVREEAEKQLKLLSGELGQTASATIGGEKQTSTPRPSFDDPDDPEDFYKPSFPHEEIGEVKPSKEFKKAHDNSKFKNPVQIKFGEARVGGAVGVSGMMGYIADLDDVRRTFDGTEPPPKPKTSKSKGAKPYNAWKQAKWRLDNWDEVVKDKPYKHYSTPEFNEDGVLEAKVMKGKTDDKQRVNELFIPATQSFADAFGVDFDRHNELFEETKRRGGQAAAIRKFKKGELVSFGGKQVKVVSQKGDDVLVETEDGEVMINMDDLD